MPGTSSATRFLAQGIAAAACTGVWFVLQRVVQRKPSDIILNEYPEIAAHYPTLALTISSFEDIDCSAEKQLFRALLEVIHDISRADSASKRTSAREMMRLAKIAEHLANKLVLSSLHNISDSEDFKSALYCKEDVMPQLEQQLDDVLHNHMLDSLWH